MTRDLGSERRRAFLRAGLIVLLVAAWSVYALRVPVSSGTSALKAALAKTVPAKTSVSWANGGAPLDAAALEALRKRAETAPKP